MQTKEAITRTPIAFCSLSESTMHMDYYNYRDHLFNSSTGNKQNPINQSGVGTDFTAGSWWMDTYSQSRHNAFLSEGAAAFWRHFCHTWNDPLMTFDPYVIQGGSWTTSLACFRGQVTYIQQINLNDHWPQYAHCKYIESGIFIS